MAEPQGIQQLGNFKLVKKLGEGGMGAVYLAEDLSLHRNVALKVLPKKFSSDKELASRFRREAKAAGQLNHQNIVGAFAVGEEAGFLFYVMEFCEGEPLDNRIKREKVVPINDALDITKQVATGLQYAHQHNFVHRDIKPANIVLTNDGIAKILDLGLSKNMADSAQSYNTISGTALGTPHYISPEQARGDQNLDGRADIYSLGCTLYHLVVGQTPFEGSTAAVIMMKHLSDPMPSPIDKRSDLPLGVVHIITKCTCKAPDDRYKDCAELLQDLERVAKGQMPLSKLPPKQQTGKAAKITGPRNNTSTRLPAERKPGVPLAALGIVAAAVLVAGVILAGRGSGNTEGDKAVKTAAQSDAKTTPTDNQTPRSGPNHTPAPPPLVSKTTRAPEASKGADGFHKLLPPATSGTAVTSSRSPSSRDDPSLAARMALPESSVAHPARWKHAVELLPLVDPQKDAVSGAWRVENGGLASKTFGPEGSWPRVVIPYKPPEEYDLKVEFTRFSNGENISLFFSLHGKLFMLVAAHKDKIYGLDGMGGTRFMEHASTREVPNLVVMNRRHSAFIQVRKQRVVAMIDATVVLDYAGHGGQTLETVPVTIPADWTMPPNTLLGVGVPGNAVYHSVQLLPVTGNGEPQRRDNAAYYFNQRQNSLANPARWKDALELLPLADPQKDAIAGDWHRDGNGGLTSKTPGPSSRARLAIPYKPPEEYDLKVEFTRLEGASDLACIATVAGRPFMYVMAVDDRFYGVDNIDGARAAANKTTANRAGLIVNGRRHTLCLQVRKQRLVTMLDGATLLQYPDNFNATETPFGSLQPLGVHQEWQLHADTMLALCNSSFTVFHSVQLIPATGAGEPQRPDDPAAKQLLTRVAVSASMPPPASMSARTAERPAPAQPLQPVGSSIQYEKALTEIWGHLNKSAYKEAVQRLEKARADPALAEMKPALLLDQETLLYPDEIRRAALLGAEVLADGRLFTLTKILKNEEYNLGKGKEHTFLDVQGEKIRIQVNSVKPPIPLPISLDRLTPQTREALTQLGLSKIKHGKLKLAFTWLLDLKDPKPEHKPDEIRKLLDEATADGAPHEKVAHLLGRLEAHEREVAAEKDYRELDAAARNKKADEAVELLAAFTKNHAGTLVHDRHSADIEKHVGELFVPGLWAMFFKFDHNGHGLGELKLKRAMTLLDTRFDEDAGIKAMLPGFFVRLRGILHSDKGQDDVQFYARCNGTIRIFVNGVRVHRGGGTMSSAASEIFTLKRGDNDITIDYHSPNNTPELEITWRPAGARYIPVPADLFKHQVAKRAEYEKERPRD